MPVHLVKYSLHGSRIYDTRTQNFTILIDTAWIELASQACTCRRIPLAKSLFSTTQMTHLHVPRMQYCQFSEARFVVYKSEDIIPYGIYIDTIHQRADKRCQPSSHTYVWRV